MEMNNIHVLTKWVWLSLGSHHTQDRTSNSKLPYYEHTAPALTRNEPETSFRQVATGFTMAIPEHYWSWRMLNQQWILIADSTVCFFFFFLLAFGPIHLFEKKMNNPHTQNLGPFMHALHM
jgi:hypothetical protein